MPTTKKQCVLVYALNVLLLINLTVIVVMLSGKTSTVQQQQASAASHDAPPRDAAGPVANASPGWIEETQPQIDETVVNEAAAPAVVQAVSFEPAFLPAPADEVALEPRLAPAPELTHEPETQDDPPVTFFGVGLD